jgi:hypothetical protein
MHLVLEIDLCANEFLDLGAKLRGKSIAQRSRPPPIRCARSLRSAPRSSTCVTVQTSEDESRVMVGVITLAWTDPHGSSCASNSKGEGR